MADPTAPGWYEVKGDPLHRRYWDGSGWVSSMRYVDGSWQHRALSDEPAPYGGPAPADPSRAPGGKGAWSATGGWVPSAGAGRKGGGSRPERWNNAPAPPMSGFVAAPASSGEVASGDGSAPAESGEGVLAGLVGPTGPVDVSDPVDVSGPEDAPGPQGGWGLAGAPPSSGSPSWAGSPGGAGSVGGGGPGWARPTGGGPSGPSGGGVSVQIAEPAPQRRWTVLLRVLLALPHLVLLTLMGIAVFVVAVIMWFATLFTRRVPPSLWAFVRDWVHWSARVSAYLYLLTDSYPPFGSGPAAYPVMVEMAPPGEMNRSEVFLRLFLAAPAMVFVDLASLGIYVVGLVAWVATLVRGSLPRSFHLAFAAIVRFQVRTNAWLYLLTDQYPPLPIGTGPTAADGGPPLTYGARTALAWTVGMSMLGYPLLLAVAIPTFLGVQRAQDTTGQFVEAVDAYGSQVQQAQAALSACQHQGGGGPCVATALQQWSSGATAFAGAVSRVSFPSGPAADAQRLVDDARVLATDLDRTAALEDEPIAMVGAYTDQVQPAEQVVGTDVTQLEADLGVTPA